MNTKTNQDKLRDAIEKILDSHGFYHEDSSRDSVCIEELEALFNQEYKKREKELLKNLLDNGHGGGNFRRLIMEKLQALERTK